MVSMVIPMPSFDSQPIFLQPHPTDGLSVVREIEGSLKKFQDLYEAPTQRPTLKNPCAADLARTHCKDAQCLKRSAETLSGPCAELLLRPVLQRPKMPEPSPEPERGVDLVSKLLGQMEGKPVAREERRRAEVPESMGYFSMTTTDGEGHTQTISGPVGASLPPELAQMASMVPDLAHDFLPELSSFFGSFGPLVAERLAPFREGAERQAHQDEEPEHESRYHGPVASIGDDPAEVAAARALKNHPCREEIMSCRQIGGHSSAEIRQCLLDHIEQLSNRCKCMVTQVEGPQALQSHLSPSSRAAAAPTVSAVTVAAAPSARVIVVDKDSAVLHAKQPPAVAPTPVFQGHPAHPHAVPVHGLPCLIMMSASLLLLLLALRKCISFCCRPAAPAPTMAVVVPPEQTSIKLMEPLRSEDIKTVVISK